VVAFNLNGEDVDIEVPDDASLLFVLANDLNISGTKYGCGLSQCGACTVLINGSPVRSCQTRVSAVDGRSVTTLSGLREEDESGGFIAGHLQQAFIDEQAAQCGYCLSGMILQAQALLDLNPTPTESEIRSALNGNLCRCGSHNRIVRAVLRASHTVGEEAGHEH